MRPTIFAFFLLPLSCYGHLTPYAGGCAAVLTPDPELQAQTEIAVDRWNAATGCSLTVGDDGVTISYVESLWVDDEGNLREAGEPQTEDRLCGVYLRAYGEILISQWPSHSCEVRRETVLTHEIGHVIAGVGGHSESGIMAPGDIAVIDRMYIEEDSLNLVCSATPCPEYNPEPVPSLSDLRTLNVKDLRYLPLHQSPPMTVLPPLAVTLPVEE